MNKIQAPTGNDTAAIKEVANNSRLASYPELLHALPTIQHVYMEYFFAEGNALKINSVGLSSKQADFLRKHYERPPSTLSYIKELRETTEHLICPMCGSMHRGTLDHLLPQNSFPEFAVFSPNLVPACKCNSKRQETLIGDNPGERILHPYFDACLADRLIAAKFDDLGPVPRISLRLVVDSHHHEYPAIAYHFCSIVKKTAIKGHLANLWSTLCRKPSLVVRTLAQGVSSIAELRQILEAELNALDDLHQGKNNWNSIFVAGLLDDKVVDWLFHELTKPGQMLDTPLFPDIC